MVALSNHMLIVLFFWSAVAAGKRSMYKNIAKMGPLLPIICLELKQHYIMCNDENVDIQQSKLEQERFARCETYKLFCDACKDNHVDCCEWAKCGECSDSPYFMRTHCKKTCGTCNCKEKNILKCKTNVAENCIGISGNFFRLAAQEQKILAADCQDLSESCSFWADTDECIKNPSWMEMFCQRSCNMCSRKFTVGAQPPGVELTQLPAAIIKERQRVDIIQPTETTIKPHRTTNVAQYPGVAPQQPGIEAQPRGVEPQSPKIEAQSHGIEPHQSSGKEPQSPGIKQQSPGIEPQSPGVEPQSPGIKQQTPGVETQSTGIEPKLPAVVITQRPVVVLHQQTGGPNLQRSAVAVQQPPGVGPQVPGEVEQTEVVVPIVQYPNVATPQRSHRVVATKYQEVVAVGHPRVGAPHLPGVQQVSRVVVQEEIGEVVPQDHKVVTPQHSHRVVPMEHYGVVVAMEHYKVAAQQHLPGVQPQQPEIEPQPHGVEPQQPGIEPQPHGVEPQSPGVVLQQQTGENTLRRFPVAIEQPPGVGPEVHRELQQTQAVVPQYHNVVTPQRSQTVVATEHHGVVAMEHPRVAAPPQLPGVQPQVPRVVLQEQNGAVVIQDHNVVTPQRSHRSETTEHQGVVAMKHHKVAAPPQLPGVQAQVLRAVVQEQTGPVILQDHNVVTPQNSPPQRGNTLRRSSVATQQPPGVGPEVPREVQQTQTVVPQYPNVVTPQRSHRVVTMEHHGVVAKERRKVAPPQLLRVQAQVPRVLSKEQMGEVIPQDPNVVTPQNSHGGVITEHQGVVAMERSKVAAPQLLGVRAQVSREVVHGQTGAKVPQNPNVVTTQHSHGVVAVKRNKVAAPQLPGVQAKVSRKVVHGETRAVIPQHPNVVTPQNSHRQETTEHHGVVAMERPGVATPQPPGVGPQDPRVALQEETGVVTMKRSGAVAAKPPVVVVAHPRRNGKTDQNSEPDCVDAYNLCAAWKQTHECYKNPAWMSFYCRESCGWCLA